MRRTLILTIAAATLVAALPDICSNRTYQLTTREGELRFPNMTADGLQCIWQIRSSEHHVMGIEFNTSAATFGTSDRLDFFVDRAALEAGDIVGTFSWSRPVPKLMQLTSSDEAIIVLHPSQSTQLRMRYRMQTSDDWYRQGASWLTTWFALWSFCIFLCLISVTWFVQYRRMQARRRMLRHGHGGMGEAGRSVLLVHAELVRRREADRRQQQEAVEAVTNDALQALPIRRWTSSHRREEGGDEEAAGSSAGGAPAAVDESPLSGDDDAECCLCMENFMADDTCRVLPCEHYFHAACIDKWFAARAYQQRSCPLCKMDPLAGTDLHVAARAAPAASRDEEEGIELAELPPVATQDAPTPAAADDSVTEPVAAEEAAGAASAPAAADPDAASNEA